MSDHMLPAEYPCPRCGSPLRLRRGRRGEFWGCSAYPRCRMALDVGADGAPVPQADPEIPCEACGAPMVIKRDSRGPFLICSTHPECRWTKRMGGED